MKSNYLITALVIVLMIAIAVLVILFWPKAAVQKHSTVEQDIVWQEPDEKAVPKKPVSYIDVYDFYDANLFNISNDLVKDLRIDSKTEVVAAVLPHHQPAGSLMADFFVKISKVDKKPETIVIVGPDHEKQGKGLASITDKGFIIEEKKLEPNTELIQSLVETRLVKLDNNIFEKEHSIGVLVPYILHHLPEVNIVAITLKPEFSETQCQALTTQLNKHLGESDLVISSIDFSHNTTSSAADKYDHETFQDIEQYFTLADASAQDFYEYGEQHLDSPPALTAVVNYAKKRNALPRIWMHTNYNEITNTDSKTPGTSYYELAFVKKPKTWELALAGDIMLDRTVADQIKQYGTEYPSIEAKKIMHSSDAAFANLESILSDKNVPFIRKALTFAANPENIESLRLADIMVVSTANNHSFDFGKVPFKDSITWLKQNDILPIGNDASDVQPIISMIEGQRIAWWGYDLVNKRQDLEKIKQSIQNTKDVDLRYVSLHWGTEYSNYPNDSQKTIAHELIDAGADLIIGHHPHVIQGIEQYKGKMIFYSLGNFVFDQRFSEETQESIVAKLRYSEDKLQTIELVPVHISYEQPRFAVGAKKAKILQLLSKISFKDELKKEISTGIIEQVLTK